MLKKNSTSVDLILRLLIHAIVLLLAFIAFKPVKMKPPAPMIASLLSGFDRAYVPPGSQFKIFKPYVPKKGRVSLILDRHNNATTKDKETSYDAQNYLAPTVINLETVEPAALVYCSSQAIADQRLAETGYQWTYRIAKGKGLARKKS